MSARVETIPDGDGGVAAALGCADGAAVIRLCGCGGCLVCCGTGNQCVYYAALDQALIDTGEPEIAAIASVPHANRLNGWTRLGSAFDVIVTVDASLEVDQSAYTSQQVKFSEEITLAPRRLRYRLGPNGLLPEERVALFGPTADPRGEWLEADHGTSIGPNDPPYCPYSTWYVDVGAFTGTHVYEYEDFADTYSLDVSATDGEAADLESTANGVPFVTPLDPLLRIQAPLVDQSAADAASPYPCDALVWGAANNWLSYAGQDNGVLGQIAGGHLYPLPLAMSEGDWADDFRPPWWDLDPVVASAEVERLHRVGGTFNASAGGGSCSISVAVSHGEESSVHWTHEETAPENIGSMSLSFAVTVKLERVDSAQCAGYGSLPANACDPVDWEHRVGRACNKSGEVVIYDPATRPGPPEDYPTFLHTGADAVERRYLATDEPSPLPAESVTWSEDACPTPGPRRAVRCRDTGLARLAPEEIAYDPYPLGEGVGKVRYTFVIDQHYNDQCMIRRCTYVVWYTPTAEPADPGAPVGVHLAGEPCEDSDSYQCMLVGCPPGVLPRPIDPCDQANPPHWCVESTMTMGLMSERGAPMPDPMAAQLKHFGGGCCG